jgi:tetratricopeptide (TPR) repeat protein
MKPEPQKPAAAKSAKSPTQSQPTPKFSQPTPKAATAPVTVASLKVPPLFRRNDWWALGICFVIVAGIYLYFLSPQVTLEDSGELSTGSFWAGIPHPPGYPFWAIYSWLWTELLPFGNVAWRVEVGDAMAEAMGCSLIAFMVSRGSSMFMESIDELRGIVGKWENAICLVCGVTAGLLMALDDTMWFESEAINRISLFGVPWVILMLLCLMRWIYAPQQRRYLYGAFFFFGISVTIHQSLLVAALGLEIAVAFTQPKLGRDMFFGNSVGFLILMAAKMSGTWTTFAQSTDMVTDIVMAVGFGSIIAFIWMAVATGGLLTEIVSCLWMGLLWVAGSSFYFYEAIAGMTNPPMEWGYPRTVEGFFHALTRGQYEKINPSDVFGDPHRFFDQLYNLVRGVADAYSWVYLLFALLPFLFFFKMKKRERNWLIAIAALYPFLGVMMTILLNPSRDKQTADLLKVFFVASHTVVAILLGYGLALTAAYMATNYGKFKHWGWIGGGLALILACWSLVEATGRHYFGVAGEIGLAELPHWVAQAFAPGQYGLPIFANLLLVALPIIFLAGLAVYRKRAPLLLTLALFAVMPAYPAMAHWFKSEQRNHWFGYWFGHDMFTPPFKGPDGQITYDAAAREQALKGTNGYLIYPEMAKDTVLYGGTDPGRFCPTYMIYCESFIPFRCQPEQDQHFSRRDVYLITQNAVADPTYLDYIRAQYNRSQQIDPPFFQMLLPTEFPKQFREPTTLLKPLDYVFETLGTNIEYHRRTGTSWFKESDFTNVTQFAGQLKAGQSPLAKAIFDRLSKETQSLLGGSDGRAVGAALAKDFNSILSGPTIYDAQVFQNVTLPPLILKAARDDEHQIPAIRVRLNRRMLEEAYPAFIAKSLGGVYPDTEIQEPSSEDSDQVYHEFYADAERRLQHDLEHPKEPKQVRGDEVISTEGGRLQVSGQGAVMKINGMLTKVIFDKNPDHEFYVEESFPLEWMYAHLTPFSDIMKINRQDVPLLSPQDVERDHAFWRMETERSIGDWITYDTSIKEICDFCEKVYVRHDYNGFKGDLKFIRDEDAQKSFSKLRNAVASSIYGWRAGLINPPEAPVPPLLAPADRARMLKESEFALKQAFAFCPYSPESVFHLMVMFWNQHRFEELREILKTCNDLDPYNGQFNTWLQNVEAQLQQMKGGAQSMTIQDAMTNITQFIKENKTAQAEQMIDALVNSGQADGGMLTQCAEWYMQLGKTSKGTAAMQKLVSLDTNRWEGWFYLARLQALETDAAGAGASLQKAFALNTADRLDMPGNAITNFHEFVAKDRYFDPIRRTPEYLQAVAVKH